MVYLKEYSIVGRHVPTEKVNVPKLYRMRIFAPNEVVAKSRFWYYLRKLKKVKKANGEVISISQIHEKKPLAIKNYGVWIRYDSRSGTHNMYKEYRETSRVAAVESCYADMAARHRARFSSVQIIKVTEVAASDVRRRYVSQFINPKLRFPLPHRVMRASSKEYETTFSAKRPVTFY